MLRYPTGPRTRNKLSRAGDAPAGIEPTAFALRLLYSNERLAAYPKVADQATMRARSN